MVQQNVVCVGKAIENEKRSRILAAIQDQQGIHKSEICRRTGLPWGTVTHHLHALVAANRIRCFRVGRRAHFAATEHVQANRLGRALLMPHSSSILDLMEGGDIYGPTALAQELEISPKTIRRHCALLIEEGHIETDGAYHPRFWRPQASH